MALYLPNRPRIIGTNFQLTRPGAHNPARGGWHQSVAMGESLWSCEIATTELSQAIAGEYAWLFAQAQDSDETVYVYNAYRSHPLAYAPGGGWGNPQIEEIDQAGSRIRLSGLSSRAIISAGDMGHWDDGPARRLHICGPEEASLGGETWVPVRPAPPAIATASLPAPFVMQKASAEMRIARGVVEQPGRTAKATLTAVQVIRRY